MNYLYYIGYAYTVYVAKQNPVKGFGETNIIRDHELTTADIVELQQSLGKNLIVNNHLQAVRPNIWSPSSAAAGGCCVDQRNAAFDNAGIIPSEQ